LARQRHLDADAVKGLGPPLWPGARNTCARSGTGAIEAVWRSDAESAAIERFLDAAATLAGERQWR
jgi:hypothetical protein